MILAWENPEGRVSITVLLTEQPPDGVIAALRQDGHMPKDIEVLIDPVLPDGPRHQWRMGQGQVVIDPSVPEPEKPLESLKAATTVAELKAALVKLLGER